MADQSIQGALTAEQLLAIWKGGVDSAYADPFLEAGDGRGLEVHTQSFAQWERVSQAVDRIFQAMFALPWIGQTNPSASGAVNATVELTFTRAGRLSDPLVLGAGLIWIDEQATDSGDSGPTLVATGRRYLLLETVVFLPGEQGPFTAMAVAEKPGFNYNDPVPGSLDLLEQPGATRNNDLAAVTVQLAPVPPLAPNPGQVVLLRGDDQPDMFTPDQLGQYVAFTSGSNEGLSGRVATFYPATSTAGTGVALEQMAVVLLASAPTHDFAIGGTVTVLSGATPVGSGLVYASRQGPGGYVVAFALLSGGAPAVGETLSQAVVGGTASGTIEVVYSDGQYTAEAPTGVPEAGGAGWRMLDWARDWRLACTNVESPTGGAIAMLDALGQEKNLPRLTGEQDGPYALRITRIADVVTPNAIKRALVRNIGPTGWCFREVGSPLLPGFFFDRADVGGDAWDYGALLFAGSYTSGSFQQGEPVQYERGLETLAYGYWGAVNTATTTSNPGGYYPPSYAAPTLTASGGADFTLVLGKQRFATPTPTITWQSGDQIVGLVSGAVFTPTGTIADPSADKYRWHCWLDYAEFRAFFIAQVPNQDLGEFGFAWDQPAAFGQSVAAWDAGPTWLNFFDGYPAGNSAYYLRLYNDLNRTIAGGVDFEIELGNGASCS